MKFLGVSILLTYLLVHPTATLIAQWRQTGGPPGGKIWCFSGTPHGTVFAATDAGLYRSSDGGGNWARTSLPFQRFWAVAANPSGHVFAVGENRFFSSTDNGNSWKEETLGAGDPWSSFTDGNARVYIASSEGLYESVDDGTTWERIDSLSGSRGIIFMTIAHDGILFGAGFDSGVYSSRDSGRTWKQVRSGSHIYALQAVSDSIVYVGATTEGVLRTTDAGTTWESANLGLGDTLVQSFSLSDGGSLFAATSGGVYKFDTVAQRWMRCTNGITSAQMLSVCAFSSGTLLAGSLNRGVFRSTDNGTTWAVSSRGLATSFVSTLVCASGGTLVCADDYAVYRSTDRGDSWTPTLVSSGFSRIVINAHDSMYVSSSSGLFLSTDDGLSWTLRSAPEAGMSPLGFTPLGALMANSPAGVKRSTDAGASWQPVDSILESPITTIVADKLGRLWSGNFYGIYQSDDDGIHWVFTGFTGMYGVYSIGVTAGNCLLAGTYGAGQEGNGPTLWRSTDSGKNWDKVLEQNAKCFCLAKNGWILSNFSGASYSSDNGTTWVPYGGGLETVTSAMASAPDGYVYVGTNGGGVYRTTSTLTEVPSDNLTGQGEYFLGQNFPNPFNPSTTIQYTIAGARGQGLGASEVRIVIYDLLGREVATLVNAKQAPGTYEVRFDGSQLASGVYFCRMVAGNFVATKKLLLMR